MIGLAQLWFNFYSSCGHREQVHQEQGAMVILRKSFAQLSTNCVTVVGHFGRRVIDDSNSSIPPYLTLTMQPTLDVLEDDLEVTIGSECDGLSVTGRNGRSRLSNITPVLQL